MGFASMHAYIRYAQEASLTTLSGQLNSESQWWSRSLSRHIRTYLLALLKEAPPNNEYT